jgi:hypothetical protein
MSQGFMWMLIVCGTIQAVLLAIMIVYFWMVFSTRRWLQTAGTVITSRVESRRTGHGSRSYSEIANTALVEYEYQVNDRSFRSDRIMIGGGKSEVELEGVLGRYPLGAKVIVYYNPADPQQAVLERAIPAARLRGCGILMLFPFGVPLVAIQIYRYSADWLIALFDSAPYAFCFGTWGLATLAYAIVLTGMAVRASAWPTTSGRIVSAGVEEISYSDGEGTLFKPNITYAYEVNGRRYKGGRMTVAFPLSSNISFVSKRTLAKYPLKTKVDVHYNPKWPAESVLHPWSARLAVPWLLAVGLIALTWALVPK